jgi:hypothetical protein
MDPSHKVTHLCIGVEGGRTAGLGGVLEAISTGKGNEEEADYGVNGQREKNFYTV